MPCSPSGTGGPLTGGSEPSNTSGRGGTSAEGNGNSSTTVSSSSATSNGTVNSSTTSTSECSPEGVPMASPVGMPPPSRPPGAQPRPPLPLPPRSAPTVSRCIHGRPLNGSSNREQAPNSANEESQAEGAGSRACWKSWNKKYVLLCGICGLSSVLLGVFYLSIYFVLRSYTTSLEYFQSIPTYIPACAMLATGLSLLAFVSRRNRLSYLIKVAGLFCLVCAILCVIVTVTTTVMHMNRLQTLRECTFYTQIHSCTCLPFTDEEPFELKLDESITTCDVIHGPLYSCLRALFGVSVIGILVSIFSCMLAYQLLSHEKKKMYWERLESRRRHFYPTLPGSGANNCSCCDEYGFAASSELYNYPWGIWDPADERFWTGGAQLYSPTGEDSSNASRSVLIGGSNPSGGPSLWLPWGGAWGAAPAGNPLRSSGQHRETSTPLDSSNMGDHDANQGVEDSRPQTTGVLLRPFIPRGLEARFGLRRQPPSGSHSRRPLSDPGVALQLPRYPPPFSEAYLPPLAFQGLEAFPRFMWDPPPPYSQPASSENIAHVGSPVRHVGGVSSPAHSNTNRVLTSPAHHNAALVDMMRDPGSPVNAVLHSPLTNASGSPAHLHKLEPLDGLSITGSLPINHRMRRLPLNHVKSLGDVTEGKRVDSLEVLFCDGKDITALDRFPSQGDVAPGRVFALKNHHLKSMSDPKSVYISGRMEQESELYFADVSSCVSLHQDGEDGMYYSEPTSSVSHKTPSPENAKPPEITHLYEQVRNLEEDEEEEGSHHTSDDTMIVHTSSSDHSLGLDMDNTYSIVSPLTDHSSASPMATDTDAYSCYNSIASPVSPHSKNCSPSPANLNLDPSRLHRHMQNTQTHLGYQFNPHQGNNHITQFRNDNEYLQEGSTMELEPRYETIPGDEHIKGSLPPQVTTGAFIPGQRPQLAQRNNTSDMNGNVALAPTSPINPSSRFNPAAQSKCPQRTDLCLPLRKAHPQHARSPFRVPEAPEHKLQTKDPEGVSTSVNKCSENEASFVDRRALPYHSSQPNSPERRLQSVQDLLYPLKSVNV